jgi:RNA polymerase sigma-70 factor (ECF subfamily)
MLYIVLSVGKGTRMDDIFHTTHWTQVLAAKEDKNALRSLCELYYAPVLHYIKRQTQTDEVYRYGGRDAEDLAQEFTAQLLGGKTFDHLERQGNRFRSYLLGAVRHFLGRIREKESAEKRGRDFKRQELLVEVADQNGLSDAVFDRVWAKSILDRVLSSLAGESPEWEQLLPWLTREVNAEIRSTLAAELGMNDTAVKVALHRLRKKFRTKIRAEIAVTVDDASEIDGELQYLIAALQG